MISATTQPNVHTCGYSAIPLRLTDSTIDLVDNYKFIVNILYDKLTISSSNAINFDDYIYTQLNYSTTHNYSVGDVLFLNDSAELYTDYYIVKQIDTNNTSVIIDLTLAQAITGTTTTAKVIPYKKSPDPDGECKTDIGNTLKDYVTQDLTDTNYIFPGDSTRFDYEVLCGYESKAVFQFNDDTFGHHGNVAFIATGLTSVDQVDFQVGDEIIVERNLADWNYYDNSLAGGVSGYVGFTSLTETHNFQVGDTVTVTGQITNAYYNGPATVGEVNSPYSLIISKPIGVSTPAEGGTIYGVVNPSYNTTTTIQDIYFQTGATSGVCIETYIVPGISTQAIAGTIKHRDGRLITNYNGLSITGKSTFNSYVNDYNFLTYYMDQYVVKSGLAALNNFSTILNTYVTGEKYRIEKSTKSWLLQHKINTGITDSVLYTWKNGNTVLGTSYILNSQSSNPLDFYVPIGLDQLVLNAGRTDSTPLAGIYSAITNYDVTATSSFGATARTNSISFEINEDCAGYDLYHLMWKDALGSWISYPFKYISSNSTSVDRKNYYQTAGNWDNSTFGYESFDKGDTSFFTRSRDIVVINSGWIEAYENALIKDLMQSAAVYIQTPDNVLFAATIQNKDIKFGSLQNEKVWQYEFTVMYANNEIRL